MVRSEVLRLRPGQTVYVLGRRNRDGSPVTAKVNGKVRVSGKRLQVPLKRGLYQFGYLTDGNMGRFSLRAQSWGVKHNPSGRCRAYPDYGGR